MWLWCRRALLASSLAAALASSGCGYALAGRGNFLPDYIQTIGIPTFQNHTSFFALAELVTDKVRTEFIGRGNYKIVPEATGADAVLDRRRHERVDRPDQFFGRAAGVALHRSPSPRISSCGTSRRTRCCGATRRCRFARSTTRPVRSRATRRVRRSVDVLQSGNQRRRARQQRVRAHGRERHSGSLLIAGRFSS